MQVPPFSLSEQISDLGTDLEEAVLQVLRSGQLQHFTFCDGRGGIGQDVQHPQ